MVKFVTLQAITNGVVLEGFRTGIEFRNTFVARKPKIALPVFHNGINKIVQQTVLISVMQEGFSFAVKFIQPSVGANPQGAALVFMNNKKHIAG